MINFTEEEQKLFKLIREYAISLNIGVVPRLAGGFVRDKILGITSNDIDIAFENISGLAFAHGLSESLKTHPTVHKISANPDKSKHLETAVLNIYGFSVDFVHLRTESYADSRIPKITPGTPEEDANRRDITINSLFYNLITGECEDFTGRGLNDIKNKQIDTPLDPKITLFDDPLRILRIFRFKSKFGFEINQRIYEAIKDQKIKDALEKKVSNERNLIEIEKMLKYPNGEVGLLEIIRNDYVKPVFKPLVMVDISTEKALRYLKLKDMALKVIENVKFEVKTVDFSILKLYLVLQFFIGKKVKTKKSEEFLNTKIIRDSLKGNRAMIKTVEALEEFIEIFKDKKYINNEAEFEKDKEKFIEKDKEKFIEKDKEEFIEKDKGECIKKDKQEFIKKDKQECIKKDKEECIKKDKQEFIENSETLMDPVEFLVKCGNLWFETLVILFSTTENYQYLNLIKFIFKNNLHESYLINPIVNGDLLVSLGTSPLEFKKKLSDSLVIQIKNPKLKAEEILLELEKIERKMQ